MAVQIAVSELPQLGLERHEYALVEMVQRGILSSAYEPGPFNERLEAANRVFTQVYRDAMRA